MVKLKRSLIVLFVIVSIIAVAGCFVAFGLNNHFDADAQVEHCEDFEHCTDHDHDCEEHEAQIALASGTYYKNGSSFFTLNSATQHYHCTNSQHSGTNDYTTSSVSGTCYTTTDRAGWSQQYYGHSCYALYGGHNVYTSNGPHHYVYYNQARPGIYRYKCSYCDATTTKSSKTNPFDSGTCSSHIIYNCSSCGYSGESSPTGECGGNITGYRCSYCQGVFSWNSTDGCGSRPWKRCNVCSGNWDGCSCTVQNPHGHTIATYYVLYSYTNIDTNATVTSQTPYAQATGFTVVFNINNANAVVTTGTTGGTMANQYMLHEHSEALSANAFTFSGHRFAGWATSAGTSANPSAVVYTNSQAISLTTTNVASGGTLNLYAVWKYEVAKPTIASNPTYTGSAVSPTLNNYNSSIMTQSGDTSATNVNISGTYSLTITLSNTSYYIWSDGTSASFSLSWNVVPRNISDGIITIPQTDYTYDGTVKKP